MKQQRNDQIFSSSSFTNIYQQSQFDYGHRIKTNPILIVRLNLHKTLRQHYINQYKRQLRQEMLNTKQHQFQLQRIQKQLHNKYIKIDRIRQITDVVLNLIDVEAQMIHQHGLLQGIIIKLVENGGNYQIECFNIIIRMIQKTVVSKDRHIFVNFLQNSIIILSNILLECVNDQQTFCQICYLIVHISQTTKIKIEYSELIDNIHLIILELNKNDLSQSKRAFLTLLKDITLDLEIQLNNEIMTFIEQSLSKRYYQALEVLNNFHFLPTRLINDIIDVITLQIYSIQGQNLSLIKFALKILYDQGCINHEECKQIIGENLYNILSQQLIQYQQN